MKRPSFQFYPADWKSNAKLRRCSEAARGTWMDVLCTLHDSDEYGVVRYPLTELARAAGIALRLAKELVEKGVLKGSDRGKVFHTHTPRHAGKDGAPVTLVEADGPCWFSSRMVLDEWHRTTRGASTRFGSTPSQQPSRSPSQRQGDGASTPSPSAEEESTLRVDIAPPKKASRRSLPDNFPDQGSQDWANNHWLAKGRADLCDSMTEEISKFRDHHTGKITMSADWPGSWRTWARNAMNFTKRQTGNARPTAHENFALGAYLATDDAA